MDIPYENIDNLRAEISRLNIVHLEQKAAIGERFSGPGAIFSTVMSLFPKSAATEGIKGSGVLDQDFVGLISRVVLPFALNKTLFRNSNFIVKTLVGIASQKASHFISEDSVTGIWDKAKGLFDKFIKKDKPVQPNAKNLQGFGVPPM